MNYFFGNARNEQGLCATPGCDGRPVHSIVYKYCTKCYDAIMEDLTAGRVPNIAQIEKPDGESADNALEDSTSR